MAQHPGQAFFSSTVLARPISARAPLEGDDRPLPCQDHPLACWHHAPRTASAAVKQIQQRVEAAGVAGRRFRFHACRVFNDLRKGKASGHAGAIRRISSCNGTEGIWSGATPDGRWHRPLRHAIGARRGRQTRRRDSGEARARVRTALLHAGGGARRLPKGPVETPFLIH